MAVQYKDYYAVLGVGRDADAADVKKAFRGLARKYHPDVSKEPDAAARMSEVNEAHAVLSDPQRRRAYDALGERRRAGERFTPPPQWEPGFGAAPSPGGDDAEFSDFFAELFGRVRRTGAAPGGAGGHGSAGSAWTGGGGARGRAGGGTAGAGEDHHATVVLTIRDAWQGGRRRVALRVPQADAAGRLRWAERTLDIDVPAGVRAGQMIRLAGQGGAGAPPGDLLLEVRFETDPRFRVDGADLAGELPVAPWEAALGAVVPVTMPDGATLRVRLPAGAQHGSRVTVRGKGLPGRTPGDLDLSVRIVLPSAFDPRARALYERMAAELTDFDARRVAAADDGRRDAEAAR